MTIILPPPISSQVLTMTILNNSPLFEQVVSQAGASLQKALVWLDPFQTTTTRVSFRFEGLGNLSAPIAYYRYLNGDLFRASFSAELVEQSRAHAQLIAERWEKQQAPQALDAMFKKLGF